MKQWLGYVSTAWIKICSNKEKWKIEKTNITIALENSSYLIFVHCYITHPSHDNSTHISTLMNCMLSYFMQQSFVNRFIQGTGCCTNCWTMELYCCTVSILLSTISYTKFKDPKGLIYQALKNKLVLTLRLLHPSPTFYLCKLIFHSAQSGKSASVYRPQMKSFSESIVVVSNPSMYDWIPSTYSF